MKAELFQKNDGMKVMVIIPNQSDIDNLVNEAFKIVEVSFGGILQNELKYIGTFNEVNKVSLLNLLEPEIVLEVGEKKEVKFTTEDKLKYLSITVPNIQTLNEIYSTVLIFNQFGLIKQKLDL